MKKILVAVDLQKDFVDGVLGSEEAKAIVPAAGRCWISAASSSISFPRI